MKKLLCLVFTVLLVTNIGAQQMRNTRPAKLNHDAPLSVKKTAVAPAQEMMMATPEDRARFRESPKTRTVRPFYKRPAGAYYSSMIAVDGAGGYTWGQDFLQFKPNAVYQFETIVDGADDNTSYTWDVFYGTGTETKTEHVDGRELAVQYTSISDVMQNLPIFYAVDGDLEDPNAERYLYQMTDFTMTGDDDNPQVYSQTPVQAWACENSTTVTEEEGIDILLSSKTLVGGGRNADQRYTFTSFYGAQPYGNNERGWWFGKNGQHIDGMAQAFEKPQHPYQLKKIYFMSDDGIICNGNVTLTCKVYRLDEIPAYNDSAAVHLGIEPGQLIATCEGVVSPSTGHEKNGFVEFNLNGSDENAPDNYCPTINYPILVTIEGYNDPEAEDLVEFTSYIAADYHVDEGYGELAYLKTPVNDAGGNFTGEYVWTGLNNYFNSGEMKTSLGIFITIEYNDKFIILNNQNDDGEYIFPGEGGAMHQEVEQAGETIVIDGIEFLTSAHAEDISTTCNGDAAPSWLSFEFEDLEESETGNLVLARVIAGPMPAGLPRREAVVYFEIPGDAVEYKFIQTASNDYFLEKGVYYMRLNANQVAVANYDYRGDLVIPTSVIHDGVSYNVVAMADNALLNCNGLSSLSIPVSVASTGINKLSACRVSSVSITGFGEWMAGALPSTVNTLYIGSGVTSVAGMNVNPASVYSYSTTPPVCDGQSFSGYDGTLTVPKSSVASYFMADYWCNFAEISGSAVEPLGISLNQDSLNMVVGDMFSLDASIIPPRATPNQASWYSSNTNVATVMNGLVRAVGKGECDIYATCVDKQVVCHVKVVEQLVTITLDQDVIAIMPNEIAVLTPSAVPELPEITVSSSDQSVAAARYIKGKVQVVGVNAGTATITVSATDDTALPATCQVYVFSQCGDVDCDGVIGISDLSILIDYLLGTGDIIPPAVGDIDGDGAVEISDVTAMIDLLLNGDIR